MGYDITMAMIPTAADVGKVAPQSSGVVQVDPKAFGAGLGAGVEKAADALIDTGLRVKAEDDKIEAQGLANKLSEYSRVLQYGDGTDQNKGYKTLSGQDAIDARADAEERFSKYREELIKSASSDRVRSLATPTFNAQSERTLTSIADHFNSSKKLVDQGVFETTANEAIRNATADAGNDAASARHAQDAFNAGKRLGEMKFGATAKDADGKLLSDSMGDEFRTKAHAAVVLALLDKPNGGDAAAKYMETNADQIRGSLRTELEKKVRDKADIDLGQNVANKYDTMLKDPALREKALEDVRSKYSGAQQKAIVTEMHLRIAEHDSVENAIRRDAGRKAWELIDSGKKVSELPSTIRGNLDGTTLASMQAYEDKRARDGRGFSQSDDPTAYNQLHQLFMSDKKQFTEFDINSLRGKLTEESWRYWQGQQRSIDTKNEAVAAKEPSYRLGSTILTEYVKAAGLKPNNPTQADKIKTATEAMRQVVDDMHANGKKPTDEDFRKALSAAFIRYEDPDKYWGSTSRFGFELPYGQEFGAAKIKDFGEKQVNNITRATGISGPDVKKFAGELDTGKQPVTVANLTAKATGIPPDRLDEFATTLRSAGKPVNLANMRELWQLHIKQNPASAEAAKNDVVLRSGVVTPSQARQQAQSNTARPNGAQ